MVTQHSYTRAIAVLPTLDTVGQAVDQLVLSGFPLAQIFLVGKDTRTRRKQDHQSEPVPVKELLHEANLETVTGSTPSMQRGMVLGNVTGGVTGFVVGLGLLAVPGLGEIVVGATLLYVLSTVGVGTLAGGAVGAWVSREMVRRLAKNYMSQVGQGNYLLVVSGSEAEINRAEHILYRRGIQPQEWN